MYVILRCINKPTMETTLNMEINDLRIIIYSRKNKALLTEFFSLFDINCLPCSYTNDVKDMLP